MNRSVVLGAIGLVALWALVQDGAAERVAGLARIPANVARRIIDPTVPAIGAVAAGDTKRPPLDAANQGTPGRQYTQPELPDPHTYPVPTRPAMPRP